MPEPREPFSHVHPGVPAAMAGELAAGIHVQTFERTEEMN